MSLHVFDSLISMYCEMFIVLEAFHGALVFGVLKQKTHKERTSIYIQMFNE